MPTPPPPRLMDGPDQQQVVAGRCHQDAGGRGFCVGSFKEHRGPGALGLSLDTPVSAGHWASERVSEQRAVVFSSNLGILVLLSQEAGGGGAHCGPRARHAAHAPQPREPHPRAQGPALCIYFDAVLTETDLYTLQCPDRCDARVGGQVLRSGNGLADAYRVTDLVQVVSGASLMLFDPNGAYLHDGSDGAAAGAGGARAPTAKTYAFVDTDLPQRFPDQFAPFMSSGFLGVQPPNRLNATFLRLPLRTPDQAQVSACRPTALRPPGEGRSAGRESDWAPLSRLPTRPSCPSAQGAPSEAGVCGRGPRIGRGPGRM